MHQDDIATTYPDPGTPVAGRSGLAAAAIGAAGATLASAVMLWAARSWDGVHFAQLLSERLTEIVPLTVFRDALTRLESSAKPLTLAGLVALQVVAGALVAVAYARLQDRLRLERAAGAVALLVLGWAALALVVAPLSGIGLLGRDAASGLGRAHGTFLLAAAVYAVVVAAFVPWPRLAPAASDPSRRRLLQTAGASLLVLPTVVSAGYITRFVRSLQRTPGSSNSASPFSRSPFSFPGMPPAITPNHEFYVVSKNFIDPDVDETDWSLAVSGLVDQPLTLTYADVLARPASEMISTLECISNPVGGEYISTAKWKGFPLRDLLLDAAIRPRVVDIALHAADDYIDTIP
ncbi:MAG TPA: molybdopterin-dependent oxidoreductase, partial [Thermomicrobiales bacterium]|nr:molybdopterin-dependent oxidoreductase [Thermomicrobiales bacterium]